jgi:hypothetical protein
MSEQLFLYKRPDHAKVITETAKDPKTGTLIVKKQSLVSAFVGIDIAVRGIAIGGNTMVEALRVLRKIEKSSHAVANLQDRYLILKQSERKIVETSVTTFNWSKFCTDNGINLWVNWLEFLDGFDPESDEYSNTWLAYDPLTPPAEYAAWKVQHDKDIRDYDARVAAAENAAADKAASTKDVGTETVTEAALQAINIAADTATEPVPEPDSPAQVG